MSDKDDWDFKVDRGVAPEEPKKKFEKKRSLEDIAEAFTEKPTQELKLDHEALPPRNARIENVKKSIALERFADIKAAPIGRRIQASLVDLIYIASLGFAGWMLFSKYQQVIERGLPSGLLANVPSPELVLEFSISILAILFFHIFPTCWYRKSFGKKIFSLRIGWKEDDCGVPKKAVLWRELVAKPLSLISVFGLLLIFTNKKRRALHDFLSGTVVYDEL